MGIRPSKKSSYLAKKIHKGKNAASIIHQIYTLDPEPIGKGAFACVYKAYRTLNPELKVAIKMIDKQFINNVIMKTIKLENKVLTTLDHPNIVKYYDHHEDESFIFIVTNFIEGRTLGSVVFENKGEHELCDILYQLTSAIAHWHSNNVAHRDIKPDNVIIDDKGKVTLIDFGLSKWSQSYDRMNSLVGTPAFMAPEVLTQDYSLAWDIWSLGVLFYNLLAGFIPLIRDLFHAEDPYQSDMLESNLSEYKEQYDTVNPKNTEDLEICSKSEFLPGKFNEDK